MLRIGGIVVAVIGLMFLPDLSVVPNRRDTSAFNRLADLGAFVHRSPIFVVTGLIAFGASFLIRGDLSE